MHRWPLYIAFIPAALFGNANRIRTLHASLDPNSIAQQLSFYELYPDTHEGEKALKKAWSLLAGTGSPDGDLSLLALNRSIVNAMVSLVNKQPNQEIPTLSEKQLETVESFAKRLSNRKLKGFYATTESEIVALPSEEIDIARAVLLSQMKDELFLTLRSYEALLDLMALQILAKLPSSPTPEQLIRGINRFIFEEMGFRFPPHSKYAESIDLYTFLPSVLDSRHGVCLGVTILYLSLAQRLDLPLEVITPPGHIYVRYENNGKVINIETTSRGVHVDTDDYLGIDTRKVPKRELKEVIGMAHINHASLYLKDEDFKAALECYKKASRYLENDKQLKELMGYCCLFIGDIEKGEMLLKAVVDHLPDHCVSQGTLAEDYLSGNADIEAVRALFLSVDESRESILKKKNAFEDAVRRCPNFRDGWFGLGTTWLQLHRGKEALTALTKRHAIDSRDPTVEYYLAVLNAKRMNSQKAWKHLHLAETLTRKRNHYPKALRDLRRQLAMTGPEYILN